MGMRLIIVKYGSLLFCLLMVANASAQFESNIYWTEITNMPASETIYYTSSRPLNWSDFKGTPDNASPAAAITASGFGYKADFKSVGNKAQLNIGVYCYFNKKTSWVKPGKNTVYILNHEQQHFDISFITAGLFFQKIKTIGLNKENYKLLLPKIYNECVDIMNRMQKAYDGQTKNGQLKEEQAKWDSYISQQLQEATN